MKHSLSFTQRYSWTEKNKRGEERRGGEGKGGEGRGGEGSEGKGREGEGGRGKGERGKGEGGRGNYGSRGEKIYRPEEKKGEEKIDKVKDKMETKTYNNL